MIRPVVRALGGILKVGGPTLVKFLENVFQKALYLVNSQKVGGPWPTCQRGPVSQPLKSDEATNT